MYDAAIGKLIVGFDYEVSAATGVEVIGNNWSRLILAPTIWGPIRFAIGAPSISRGLLTIWANLLATRAFVIVGSAFAAIRATHHSARSSRFSVLLYLVNHSCFFALTATRKEAQDSDDDN